MSKRFKIGDLVRLQDNADKDRDIGIIVDLSPKQAHLVSHGKANIVQVFWPKINDSDWEYDFFLEKLDKEILTKEK